MEFLFSAVMMIFIMGIFISLIVTCGTFQAEEEAKRRKAARQELRRLRERGGDEEKK